MPYFRWQEGRLIQKCSLMHIPRPMVTAAALLLADVTEVSLLHVLQVVILALCATSSE